MNRVLELRTERGLKQVDLASAAGISLAYVRQLESDDPSTPTLNVARRLAAALSCSVDDLFPAAPSASSDSAA